MRPTFNASSLPLFAPATPSASSRPPATSSGLTWKRAAKLCAAPDTSLLLRFHPRSGSLLRRLGRAPRPRTGRNVRARRCARDPLRPRRLRRELSAETLDLEKIKAHPKIFVGYSDLTTLADLLRRCGRIRYLPRSDGGQRLGARRRRRSGFLASALSRARHRGTLPLNADVQLTGRGRSRRNSLRRMPFHPGGISGHALRNPHRRHDPVSRRRRRQAVSDRPHADAIEAGGTARPMCAASSSARCWTASRPQTRATRCEEVIMRIVGDLGVPVAFGVRSGHVTRGNITLPFGVRARLDSQRQASQR